MNLGWNINWTKTKSESDPRHILVEVDLIIMIKN
jgi:hypothetical protein